VRTCGPHSRTQGGVRGARPNIHRKVPKSAQAHQIQIRTKSKKYKGKKRGEGTHDRGTGTFLCNSSGKKSVAKAERKEVQE